MILHSGQWNKCQNLWGTTWKAFPQSSKTRDKWAECLSFSYCHWVWFLRCWRLGWSINIGDDQWTDGKGVHSQWYFGKPAKPLTFSRILFLWGNYDNNLLIVSATVSQSLIIGTRKILIDRYFNRVRYKPLKKHRVQEGNLAKGNKKEGFLDKVDFKLPFKEQVEILQVANTGKGIQEKGVCRLCKPILSFKVSRVFYRSSVE